MEPQQILNELGYDSFKEGQLEAIRKVLDGNDVLAIFPTGYGKSLIYRVLSKLTEDVTVVISPLISLMKDQVDFTSRFDPSWSTFINSSLSPGERRKRLWEAANRYYKMIYIAPERLRTVEFRAMLEYLPMELLVVDEAHCVTMWGHDFRPDYLLIKQLRHRFNKFIALTATVSPSTAPTLVDDLGGNLEIFKPVPVVRRNFNIRFMNTPRIVDKFAQLRKILRGKDYNSGIIYTATRQEADLVAEFLRHEGFSAASYHAGLAPLTRTMRQDSFMSGQLRFMAATSAFGMGIDKPDIDLILHWNIPDSIESYYQEIGRGGRDGREVDATMFVSWEDVERKIGMIKAQFPSADMLQDMFSLMRENGRWIKDELFFDPQQVIAEMDIDSTMLNLGLAVASAMGMFDWKENITSRLTLSENGHTYEINVIERAIAAGESPFEVEKKLWLSHFSHDLDFKKTGPPLYTVAWKSYMSEGLIESRLKKMLKAKLDAFDSVLHMIGSTGCRLVYLEKYFGERTGKTCGKCDICTGETAPLRDKTIRREVKLFLSSERNIKSYRDEILTSSMFYEKAKPSILPDALNNRDKIGIADSIENLLKTLLSNLSTQFRPILRPSSRIAKWALNLGMTPEFLSDMFVTVKWTVPYDIIEFLSSPHPIEIGGNHFYGYALDYYHAFSLEGKKLSTTASMLQALRMCRRMWNNEFLAQQVQKVIERFEGDMILVPVKESKGECSPMEFISRALLNLTDMPTKSLSELERGDIPLLLFEEFRDTGKYLRIVESVTRRTGNTARVIAIVYRR